MEVSDAHIAVSFVADRFTDIEDMLKTVAFIRGHKWTSMMVKRVYFGNWLREYASYSYHALLFMQIAICGTREDILLSILLVQTLDH